MVCRRKKIEKSENGKMYGNGSSFHFVNPVPLHKGEGIFNLLNFPGAHGIKALSIIPGFYYVYNFEMIPL